MAAGFQASNEAEAAALLHDLREAGAAPYAVIGDSHSLQMVRRDRRGDRWLLPFHWLCRAASARGIGNEAGRSGAAGVVRAALAALQPHKMPVILKFGQVDVEFVYAFKRIESGETPFDEARYVAFVDETAERYAAALDALVPEVMRRRTIVASIFPPALSDAAWIRGYANAAVTDQHADRTVADLSSAIRSLEIPSLSVRTRMHARFNAKMQGAAADMKMGYLDGFTPLVGSDGALAPRYRGRRDGGDHHLAFQAARRPLIAGLWNALDEQDHV
jgi:hypothetical protein